MAQLDTHESVTSHREAIRVELRATQAAFHALLTQISEADWDRRCIGSDWTIGETLSHITADLGFYPAQVERARKGRGIPRLLPASLVNKLNTVITRRGARKATPQSLRQQYDARLAAVTATLNDIQEDEWNNGARFFGAYQTVVEILHRPAHHFNEHATQIRQTLRQC